MNLRNRIVALFGLDLRSVALFRFGLAALTVGDLLCRFADARAFYTDSGVLPRSLQAQMSGKWDVSLHLASGETAVILALMTLQLVLALMVMSGHRTRLAAVLSFILLGSLQTRNPLVLVPGDSLLVALWFWAMFLPLAARWSVDAALSPTEPPIADAYRSWGSAGILIQIAVYVGLVLAAGLPAAALPLAVALLALLPGPFWSRAQRWLDHDRRLRIYYDKDCAFCQTSCVLMRHLLVLPRTELLPAQDQARIRTLMETRNSWVVVDSDDVAHTKWRAFVAVLRHSLLLRWIAPLASLRMWERAGDAVYDWIVRHRPWWGTAMAHFLPPRDEPFVPGRAMQCIAALFVILLPLWGLAQAGVLPAGVVHFLSPPFELLAMDERRGALRTKSLRMLVAGRTVDGTEVNVLDPGAPLFEQRFEQTQRMPLRWRAYQARLVEDRYEPHRRLYAAYLCRRWNAGHPGSERALSIKLIDLVQPAEPSATAPDYEQHVLWRSECAAAGGDESG